jgi:hypothetical protein
LDALAGRIPATELPSTRVLAELRTEGENDMLEEGSAASGKEETGAPEGLLLIVVEGRIVAICFVLTR